MAWAVARSEFGLHARNGKAWAALLSAPGYRLPFFAFCRLVEFPSADDICEGRSLALRHDCPCAPGVSEPPLDPVWFRVAAPDAPSGGSTS